MHWGWGQHWGMAGCGGWTVVLFWVLVIAGVVLIVRLLTGRPKSGPGGETAIEILRQRYARGEISKAEYEEKLKDLR